MEAAFIVYRRPRCSRLVSIGSLERRHPTRGRRLGSPRLSYTGIRWRLAKTEELEQSAPKTTSRLGAHPGQSTSREAVGEAWEGHEKGLLRNPDPACALLGSNHSHQAVTSAKHPAERPHRSQRIIRHVARGLTNREIAEQLVVSTNTVRSPLDHIYEKRGVHTCTAAVAAATP